MKNLIRHFLMNYHFRMALKYDKKFKFHCKKHNAIFNERREESHEKAQR